jgi:hypothetical protein
MLYLVLYGTMVTMCTSRFNIQKMYILPTKCLSVGFPFWFILPRRLYVGGVESNYRMVDELEITSI